MERFGLNYIGNLEQLKKEGSIVAVEGPTVVDHLQIILGFQEGHLRGGATSAEVLSSPKKFTREQYARAIANKFNNDPTSPANSPDIFGTYADKIKEGDTTWNRLMAEHDTLVGKDKKQSRRKKP